MIVLRKLKPRLQHSQRRLFLELDCTWTWPSMCAGLAHSVGRSWCGVINSPETTFVVIIKPPRRRLSQRRSPLPKLLWADLLLLLKERCKLPVGYEFRTFWLLSQASSAKKSINQTGCKWDFVISSKRHGYGTITPRSLVNTRIP